MIEVNKTTRKYNINPKMLVAQAFDESYARYANEQVAAPPDKVSAISSCLSFSILIAILILTAFTYTENVMLWYGLAGLCLLLLGRSAYKYYKARKEYLSKSEWTDLYSTAEKYFPALCNIKTNPKVSVSEYQICVLTKLGLRINDIIYLTQISASNISNMRSRMLSKLFGVEGGAKDFDIRIKSL